MHQYASAFHGTSTSQVKRCTAGWRTGLRTGDGLFVINSPHKSRPAYDEAAVSITSFDQLPGTRGGPRYRPPVSPFGNRYISLVPSTELGIGVITSLCTRVARPPAICGDTNQARSRYGRMVHAGLRELWSGGRTYSFSIINSRKSRGLWRTYSGDATYAGSTGSWVECRRYPAQFRQRQFYAFRDDLSVARAFRPHLYHQAHSHRNAF